MPSPAARSEEPSRRLRTDTAPEIELTDEEVEALR
jgi:hypothetical protein